MHPPTLIDLFAGAGGASLGLARAGWQHLACVERDPAATLRAAGFPTVEADLGDVDLSPWTGAVDLLWGSPPCQPGSVAGPRRGALDPRDGWPLLLAAIHVLRPTWLVADVSGLAHVGNFARARRPPYDSDRDGAVSCSPWASPRTCESHG